jgi:NTP pyrophosphatase (non-canonical NTP hydrolase)
MMTFEEYQRAARSTADYPQQGNNIQYPVLGLTGEAGEVADKIKKLWRNKGQATPDKYSTEDRRAVAKELGDVLWYVSASASELGYTLEQIAIGNIDKLLDRQARGVIKSEGDNR